MAILIMPHLTISRLVKAIRFRRIIRIMMGTAFLLIALGTVLAPQRSHAEASEEYRLKAAFIYNFAKFVQWPRMVFAGPTSPVVLGIIGNDPFGEALEAIRGKLVEEHKLLIKHIGKTDQLEDLNILFIPSSEQKRLGQIQRALGSKPILTISDIDDFVKQGGMIGFIQKDGKIRFEINLTVARKVGLEMSSKLLQLAEMVIR